MRYVLITLLLFIVSCGSDSVTIPDNSGAVNNNSERILLLEQNNVIIDNRLSVLEQYINELQEQVDQNSEDISDLLDALDDQDCWIEYRDIYTSESGQLRADVYVACDGYGEFKLKNNQLIDVD